MTLLTSRDFSTTWSLSHSDATVCRGNFLPLGNQYRQAHFKFGLYGAWQTYSNLSQTGILNSWIGVLCHLLLPLPRRSCFRGVCVCLFVCVQNNLKSAAWICMKLFDNVVIRIVNRWLHFGGDPGHSLEFALRQWPYMALAWQKSALSECFSSLVL